MSLLPVGSAFGIYQGMQGGIIQTRSDRLITDSQEPRTEPRGRLAICWKSFELGRNHQILQVSGDMLGIMDGTSSTVHAPSHVMVVDADNRSIGATVVDAPGKTYGHTAQLARENRRPRNRQGGYPSSDFGQTRGSSRAYIRG